MPKVHKEPKEPIQVPKVLKGHKEEQAPKELKELIQVLKVLKGHKEEQVPKVLKVHQQGHKEHKEL